jgi:hypothetical protein
VNPEKATALRHHQYRLLYPSTTFKYRGIVTGDIDTGDTAHELMVDFGTKGVWLLLDRGGPWLKKSDDNPEHMIGANIDSDTAMEVLTDFGTIGLWYYNHDMGGGSWTQLSGDDPENIIAVDDDADNVQELHVDFGSKGLWRYDSSLGWRKLTNDNPITGFRSDFATKGFEETIWGFSSGLYAVSWGYGPAASWDKMSNDLIGDDNVSVELGIGDDSEEVVCDFGAIGLWRCDKETSSETWSKLSEDNPSDIRAGSEYILASFNGISGLWKWREGFIPHWIKCTNDTPSTNEAFCEIFLFISSSLTHTITAVDFAYKGLWALTYSWPIDYPIWAMLTLDSPEFMLKSNLDGDGDYYLICDFGSKGLWYYSGKTLTWTKLTDDSPDQID